MNTNFLKITLLLSSMLTMMAGAVVAPSLPQLTKHFIHIPHVDILSRLIITLPAIFIAAFSPFFGWLIDSYGRKNTLVVTLVAYAVAGVSGYGVESLYVILIGRAFLGIAVAGIMTSTTTLIADYFENEERNHFMGMQGAFVGIGGVVFISMAGLLADIQWQLPFLIYLFSVPIFLMATYFIYEPQRKLKELSLASNTSEYVPYKRIALVLLLSFVGIVFFYMLPVQIPYLLDSMSGVSNTKVGLAISSATFSSALVSANYRRIRQHLSFLPIYIIAFSFMGIGYLIVAQAASYMVVVSGLMIAGLGFGLYMPSGNLWMMELAPEHMRGRFIGQVSLAAFTAMFLSPIFLQPVVDAFTINGAFAFASILLFAMAIALLGGTLFFSLRKQSEVVTARNRTKEMRP